MNDLINSILNTMHIPKKHQDQLLAISELKSLKKGEYFIQNGQIPKKFGIVLKGLCRYFYIHPNGDEFTKGIILPANLLIAYSAMLYHSPALYNIQALENSDILQIDYQNWQQLQDKDPFWDKFTITMLQKAYTIKEKREKELLLCSAEERYQIFLSEFGELEKRIKQHIIASYLGIKKESLSRIRKNLAKTSKH